MCNHRVLIFHLRHHFNLTASLYPHVSYWLFYITLRLRLSSSTALNLSHTRSDTSKNTVCFHLPAADETIPHPSAYCGGKKLFSNILHLPLFISLPWRMPLTACKLIYNAVSPPSWVGDGRVRWGSVLRVCGKVKDLSVALLQ